MHPQANSLSSITQLAGNPPRFPRNPTEQKRESLVLYIARVPGSKDVILTTMKPRLKNVTAEDVLNCLYYFHVNTPSDIFLMGDMQVSEASEPSYEQLSTPIARKPLPKSSTAEVSKELPQVPESGWQTETILSRAPSGALTFQKVLKAFPPQRPPPSDVLHQQPSLPQRPAPDAKNVPPRRPLGPRPYIVQAETNQGPISGCENMPIESDIQRKPPVARNNKVDAQAGTFNGKFEEKSKNLGPLPNISNSTAREAFSITIIRRDPASGAQWNIGNICDLSITETRAALSVSGPMQQRLCSSISIQLTTPGYGQFRPPLAIRSMGDGCKSEIHPPEHQDNPQSFDRLVHMVWSKSWQRKYKQHKRSSSDQTSASNSAFLESGLNVASVQVMIDDAKSNMDILNDSIYGSGFLSPWSGRCDFSTSKSGRSLICKHNLNNSTTISGPTASTPRASAEISELRFNLPSSSSAGISTSPNPYRRPASSYVSNCPSEDSNAIPTPPATSYAALYPSDDEDNGNEANDVLDLSLGREKAGGGIRGKRVKLGKLIVHDEGLKMLDLVIAANMGVWWTVWER